jgi:hypothetical protein
VDVAIDGADPGRLHGFFLSAMIIERRNGAGAPSSTLAPDRGAGIIVCPMYAPLRNS